MRLGIKLAIPSLQSHNLATHGQKSLYLTESAGELPMYERVSRQFATTRSGTFLEN